MSNGGLGQNPFSNNEQGFTLFEVILVLTIVVVLSAVILTQNSGFAAQAELTSQTDLLKSQLRYAQARSLNANQVWGLTAQGNQLWLFNGGSTGNPVLLPSERTTPVLYASADLSDLTVSDFTVSFDDLGRPCQGDAGTTPRTAVLTITLTHQRTGPPEQIQITPHTGFIP